MDEKKGNQKNVWEYTLDVFRKAIPSMALGDIEIISFDGLVEVCDSEAQVCSEGDSIDECASKRKRWRAEKLVPEAFASENAATRRIARVKHIEAALHEKVTGDVAALGVAAKGRVVLIVVLSTFNDKIAYAYSSTPTLPHKWQIGQMKEVVDFAQTIEDVEYPKVD